MANGNYLAHQLKQQKKAHEEQMKKQNKKRTKKNMPSHVGLANKLKTRKEATNKAIRQLAK